MYKYFIPHLSAEGVKALCLFLASIKAEPESFYKESSFDLCLLVQLNEKQRNVMREFIELYDLTYSCHTADGRFVSSTL